MKISLKFNIFAHLGPKLEIWQNLEIGVAMKIMLKFNIFTHRRPVKTWNMAKSRNWSRDENLAQI